MNRIKVELKCGIVSSLCASLCALRVLCGESIRAISSVRMELVECDEARSISAIGGMKAKVGTF